MLTNITMGQYYPVDSKVHRLDPRIKLILTIAFIVAVFMAKTFAGYAILLLFVYGVARLANVPFRMLLRGLRPLRLILILTFMLNLFFTAGETVCLTPDEETGLSGDTLRIPRMSSNCSYGRRDNGGIFCWFDRRTEVLTADR